MTHNKLYKSKIATSLSLILGTGLMFPVQAQEASENDNIEVIQVSGIRSSVQESMGIKRDSAGVVDAISAEDIGKFPDTNLAESLQRITGISISRNNGEGSQITVRGFGPQFNTVLVNGRQMASENDSRAFSFDTIASELVSSLDVHKTSTATMQSGGVGSTININTSFTFYKPYSGNRSFPTSCSVKISLLWHLYVD